MASSNQEQAQKIKKSPAGQSEATKSKETAPASKNKFLINALFIIVALGALAIAAYSFFLSKQIHTQLAHQNTNFSKQLDRLEQKQKHVQERINAKENNTKDAQIQLHTQFDHLNKQVQNAMSQKFYQKQDWLLLKARYYLELAQINAHWSNSTDSSRVLLEQADQLLKQFNDPKIFNIRQAIAKDIAKIESIPHVDIAGLLSQLDGAQNNINDLGIPLPVSTIKPKTEDSLPSSSNSSTWRLRLQDSMNLLEKLVVVRRHDQSIKPLISPLFEAMLKESLHLKLEEVQWAVLNNEPVVYQIILNQAVKSLKMNFNENTANTAALIKKLTELQQINITQTRAAIGSALPMLNDLIDTQKTIENQSLNSTQGGNQ